MHKVNEPFELATILSLPFNRVGHEFYEIHRTKKFPLTTYITKKNVSHIFLIIFYFALLHKLFELNLFDSTVVIVVWIISRIVCTFYWSNFEFFVKILRLKEISSSNHDSCSRWTFCFRKQRKFVRKYGSIQLKGKYLFDIRVFVHFYRNFAGFIYSQSFNRYVCVTNLYESLAFCARNFRANNFFFAPLCLIYLFLNKMMTAQCYLSIISKEKFIIWYIYAHSLIIFFSIVSLC